MAKKSLNDDKLIGLVQSRNVIYDKTDRFYTSKAHVRNAWKEIAMEMNTTVLACQKRWRYLRDYFVRQLHTLPENNKPPVLDCDQPGKKKTLWSLFERLQFLAPFSSTRRGRTKIGSYEYILDIGQRRQHAEELDSLNSLSSNNSAQNSYDLNYLQLLQYQQQLGDYLRSSERDVDKALSEHSVQQMVVDVDQYDAEDEREEHVDEEDEDDDDQDEVVSVIQPVLSMAKSMEDRTTPTTSTTKRGLKRRNSEMYDELMDILRTKRHEVECDEHEHFFKSLLVSVRKIDADQIMLFRTEIMQIVTKYLYASQGESVEQARDDSSNVVVIETDQLHWRKNLRKYNQI